MAQCCTSVRFAVALLACASLIPVAQAQLPATRLDTIFPAGGKAGSEFELAIRGADLDDLQRIHFSHDGITATAKPPAEGEKPDPKKAATEATFVVKIAGDVPAGKYEAWAVGRFGMSNPRIFAVGTQEELIDDGKNNSSDSPREVAIGQLANGMVDKDAVDFYSFNAKAGQTITCDCQAQRIDSKMDGTLVLHDASGKELAIARDNAGLDPTLTTTVPADGTYALAVYDFTYEGGAEYFYRLSIHEGPQVSFVFPPVVEAGTTAKVTAYGQNLPGGQAADGMGDETMQQVTLDVSMPAESADADDVLSVTRDAVALDTARVEVAPANKAMIGLASAPVVLEQEPNSTAEEAQSVNVPCEYVGRFQPQGDRDWVTFSAKANDVLWLEVISQQMGSPADPMMVIEQVTTNEKGEQSVKQIAEVDDAGNAGNADVVSLATKDPSFRLEVKEDATFRVLVYDLYDNAANDPASAYRLAIRPIEPDFRLVAYAPPGGDQNKKEVTSTTLRRGGTTAIEVKVIRRDGFSGEIDITAEGLPAGVSCPQVTVPSGDNDARIVLVAEESAATWSGTFTVVGKSQHEGNELVRRARAGTLVWGTANIQESAPIARLSGRLSLAVIDDMVAPAAVTLGGDDMVELKVGEKIDVPVKVARFGEFKGPLKLNAVGLPKDIKVPEVNITGDEANISIDLTKAKMKEGTYTVHLQGTTKVKYTRPGEDKPKDVDVAVLSTPVRIRVAPQE